MMHDVDDAYDDDAWNGKQTALHTSMTTATVACGWFFALDDNRLLRRHSFIDFKFIIVLIILSNMFQVSGWSSRVGRDIMVARYANINNVAALQNNRDNRILSPYQISGLIAVHKPVGMTSNDVVVKIKRILLNQAKSTVAYSSTVPMPNTSSKIKVGHGGTLDPLAEGVLVLGIGKGTSLLQVYLAGSKGYRAQAKLGIETDSLDTEGKVVATKDASHVSIEKLESALPKFRGNILQTPPMFSALKKDGKKLYDLARKGQVVERDARSVTVYKLELIGPSNTTKSQIVVPPEGFELDIECSGGFYVRSLIDDLAKQVDSLAHMTALLRTKQGLFSLEDCLPPVVESWTYENIVNNYHHCQKRLKSQ